jgi:hypothetical protein
MYFRLHPLTILLFLTFAAETTVSAAERVMGLEMRDKMEWRGFSVLKLPDCWFFYRSEQCETRGLFHRDFVDPEHTLTFQVQLKKLPESGDPVEALREDVRRDQAVVIDSTEKRTTHSGQAAISYARKLWELKLSRQSKKAIVTRERGWVMVHPFLPNTVVDIVFSETAPEDELHAGAFSQANAIMNRVALEAP